MLSATRAEGYNMNKTSKTVTVQQSGGNVYVNLPKEIRILADIDKGDTLLVTGDRSGKLTIEKV